MSEASNEPKAEAMERNEEDITNGLSETMDIDESSTNKSVDESKTPGKITKVSRKSSSSVSSEKSASKGTDKQAEDKNIQPDSSSDDDDFVGFSLPIDGSARERFLQFLMKANESAQVDDEVRSQSDKMSVDNADSDSNTESTAAPGKTSDSRPVSVRKSSIDIYREEFKKPFEFGWVREVIFRTTSANPIERARRSADVFYFTPSGKKVRSIREVAEHLTGELTTSNFTFVKDVIGINDPKKEIVRQATDNRLLRSGDESPTPQTKKSTPTAKSKPKGAAEVQGKASTPKIAFKFANKKLAVGKKPERARKSLGGTDGDSSEDTGWDMAQKNPTREVCSIECRLAMGLIPSLQCVSCLCLYHPECVGVQQDKLSASKPYNCKNCQGMSGQESSNPKTNNVPPPPALIPLSPQNTSNFPRKSVSKTDAKTNPRQNIVGTVTTWLPSSSSIQVSQSSPTPKTSTTSTAMSVMPTSSTKSSASEGPRQGLLEIGSNAFVVVPRHNVVNVSNQMTSAAPAVAATANNGNPSQTQTNGILLVPLSVQPPDSTLADTTSVPNSVRTVNPGVVAAGSTTNAETNGLKRVSDSSVDDDAPPAKVSAKVKEMPPKYYPNNFFSMSNAATMTMQIIFQYLKVHELLRATQVNKTWQFIATHQSQWETVRMKNTKVRDFEGFGNSLRKYNTRSLDLRKMITPESPEATAEMWSRLASVISTLPNLRRVDFGRCAPSAIEVVAAACPHLESITSLSIRGPELNLSPIANCRNLVELKLKSFGGIEVKNLSQLKQLTNLKSLFLTSVKNLEGTAMALPESLENLELGECVTLPEKFAVAALSKLVNLKRLRLERGSTGCPTLTILQTIANLPNLTQLELINFDIKPGFDKALSKCSNIKVLLIIPTYVTQSATTNHVVMGGVSKLSASLQYFIWGLTLELLRVTDLFIDQVEGGKSKSGGPSGKKTGAGDSIPILKPLSEDGLDSSREGGTSQVDILGLPKLQRVLSTLLPQTKIKILKIPVSATWRQTVTDIPV